MRVLENTIGASFLDGAVQRPSMQTFNRRNGSGPNLQCRDGVQFEIGLGAR